MSKSSSIDQLGWTQRFIESSGRPSAGHSFDRLRKSWWFNPLNSSSMRLSKEGANYATTHAKIHYYRHSLEQIILPKTLLQLEKILDYPYYIPQLKTIVVFDERTSMTLTLYNNDLQLYLDNVQKFN
jgi:hypothetical protein